MKTITCLSIMMLAVLSSCKKDYTCVCTNSGTTISTTTIRAKESKAKEECSAMSSSGNNGKTCAIQ